MNSRAKVLCWTNIKYMEQSCSYRDNKYTAHTHTPRPSCYRCVCHCGVRAEHTVAANNDCAPLCEHACHSGGTAVHGSAAALTHWHNNRAALCLVATATFELHRVSLCPLSKGHKVKTKQSNFMQIWPTRLKGINSHYESLWNPTQCLTLSIQTMQMLRKSLRGRLFALRCVLADHFSPVFVTKLNTNLLLRRNKQGSARPLFFMSSCDSAAN